MAERRRRVRGSRPVWLLRSPDLGAEPPVAGRVAPEPRELPCQAGEVDCHRLAVGLGTDQGGREELATEREQVDQWAGEPGRGSCRRRRVENACRTSRAGRAPRARGTRRNRSPRAPRASRRPARSPHSSRSSWCRAAPPVARLRDRGPMRERGGGGASNPAVPPAGRGRPSPPPPRRGLRATWPTWSPKPTRRTGRIRLPSRPRTAARRAPRASGRPRPRHARQATRRPTGGRPLARSLDVPGARLPPG